MKNSIKYAKSFIFLFIIILTQSCLNSDDNYEYVQFGTVQMLDNADQGSLFFLLDSNQALYPKNPGAVASLDLQDKDRVFVQFTDLEENHEKYDLYANIQIVQKLRTETIKFIESEEQTEDLLESSDAINIVEAYVVNNFLNLKYTYKGGRLDSKEHDISIYATKEISEETRSSTTLELILTHDAKEDKGNRNVNGVISFPLDNIQNLINNKNEIKISAKAIIGGVQDYIIQVKQNK